MGQISVTIPTAAGSVLGDIQQPKDLQILQRCAVDCAQDFPSDSKPSTLMDVPCNRNEGSRF